MAVVKSVNKRVKSAVPSPDGATKAAKLIDSGALSAGQRLLVSLLRMVLLLMGMWNGYLFYRYKEDLVSFRAMHPVFTVIHAKEFHAFLLAAAMRITFAVFPSRRSARFAAVWQCVEIAYYIKTRQDIQQVSVIDQMKLAFYLIPQMQTSISQVVAVQCAVLVWILVVWSVIPEKWGRLTIKRTTVKSN